MPGTPSVFVCPECHGTLFEVHDGEVVRFRCHVGHAFSAETLFAEQSESIEAALWTALRALEESGELARRMAARARSRDHHRTAERYEGHAEDREQHATLLRRILIEGQSNGAVIPDPTEHTKR